MTEFIPTTSFSSPVDLSPAGIIDLAYSSVYHGIDWVYTYSETLFMYDFNINYNLFSFNVYQDTFDYNYYSVWYNTLDISYYSLFWSVLLDNFINLSLSKFHIANSWCRSSTNSIEYSLILFNMPEFPILSNSFMKGYILPFASHIDVLITSMYDYENTINPILLVPHFLFFWLLAFYFFYTFFSYYLTPTKEEMLVDHDLLIASFTVESEEEIGSIDDLLFGSSLIVFIFLWYFYANFFFAYSQVPEFSLTLYVFPFLFFLIFFIPIQLTYDFGLYFVCYLRGVGKAPIAFVEIMYDYIGYAAFFIRLIVQNVRLILMLFTFASFHELVIVHGLEKEWVIGDETFTEDLTTAVTSFNSFGYFLFFKLSGHIIYFFYELFHLLFVVTAQIIAFNAMVFWLFLFLYTMFSSEVHEKFFRFKRLLKKKIVNKYKVLKKNILKK